MGRIIIILLGVVFLFAGGMETKLRFKSSDPPTAYSLADLEARSGIANLNGSIDKHYALYDALVFSYRARDGDTPPRKDQHVEAYWYPVVSQYPSAKGEPIQFRVIVKQSNGRRVNELPQGVGEEGQMNGLFLDGFHSLRGEERDLLKKSFPHLDFERVLLFEVGRQRGSLSKIGILFLAGALLVGLPIVAWNPPKQRRNFKSEQASASDSGKPPK